MKPRNNRIMLVLKGLLLLVLLRIITARVVHVVPSKQQLRLLLKVHETLKPLRMAGLQKGVRRRHWGAHHDVVLHFVLRNLLRQGLKPIPSPVNPNSKNPESLTPQC